MCVLKPGRRAVLKARGTSSPAPAAPLLKIE
jgi:hypothetical protein